ncbi:hypothetical protein AB0J43_02700 [Nonomuraea fuscirosea]
MPSSKPSTELAVRHVVRFRGPAWNSSPIQIPLALPLPKSTLDHRWRACADHHTACDCREAEMAEEISELRGDRDLLIGTLRDELAGHATWAYAADNERDEQAECKCTGCRIVRRLPDFYVGGYVVTTRRSSPPAP